MKGELAGALKVVLVQKGEQAHLLPPADPIKQAAQQEHDAGDVQAAAGRQHARLLERLLQLHAPLARSARQPAQHVHHLPARRQPVSHDIALHTCASRGAPQHGRGQRASAAHAACKKSAAHRRAAGGGERR